MQDKVNSLLSSNQFNFSMDGLLPQVDTLCILRIHLDDDLQWSREDEKEKVQEDGEDNQEKIQEDGQEEEEGGGARLAGLPAGPGRPPSATLLSPPAP